MSSAGWHGWLVQENCPGEAVQRKICLTELSCVTYLQAGSLSGVNLYSSLENLTFYFKFFSYVFFV